MKRLLVVFFVVLGGTLSWALDPVSNTTLTQRVLKQRARQIELFKMPFSLISGKGEQNKSQLSLFKSTEPSPVKPHALFATESSSETCTTALLDTKIDPKAVVRKKKATTMLSLVQPAPEPSPACVK